MESFVFCRAYHVGAPDRVFAEESAPEHYPRDRTFHLRHVKLNITLDEKEGTVEGTATLTLSPLNDGLRDIDLDGEDLHIQKAAAEFTLSIAYDCKPKKGMFFIRPSKAYPRHPWMIWTQGEEEDNRCWFPSYDAPNQRMTSGGIGRGHEKPFAISNGRLLKESRD